MRLLWILVTLRLLCPSGGWKSPATADARYKEFSDRLTNEDNHYERLDQPSINEDILYRSDDSYLSDNEKIRHRRSDDSHLSANEEIRHKRSQDGYRLANEDIRCKRSDERYLSAEREIRHKRSDDAPALQTVVEGLSRELSEVKAQITALGNRNKELEAKLSERCTPFSVYFLLVEVGVTGRFMG